MMTDSVASTRVIEGLILEGMGRTSKHGAMFKRATGYSSYEPFLFSVKYRDYLDFLQGINQAIRNLQTKEGIDTIGWDNPLGPLMEKETTRGLLFKFIVKIAENLAHDVSGRPNTSSLEEQWLIPFARSYKSRLSAALLGKDLTTMQQEFAVKLQEKLVLVSVDELRDRGEYDGPFLDALAGLKLWLEKHGKLQSTFDNMTQAWDNAHPRVPSDGALEAGFEHSSSYQEALKALKLFRLPQNVRSSNIAAGETPRLR
jgi:hypothetical protein